MAEAKTRPKEKKEIDLTPLEKMTNLMRRLIAVPKSELRMPEPGNRKTERKRPH